MGLCNQGITHKKCTEELVAALRTTVKDRKDIYRVLAEISQTIPQEIINGPPFCIFQFITSVKDGHDVEVGFPIKQTTKAKKTKTRTLQELDVLSLTHTGSPDTISGSYKKLFSTAASYGIISDEFCREVYTDWNGHEARIIELQFIIHDWHDLLATSIEKILGKDKCKKLMGSAQTITVESSLDERFRKTKEIVEKLGCLVDDKQMYDIVSRCAHRFPRGQIDKLRKVYQKTYKKTGKAVDAVDAVIKFMATDPGWLEKPIRKGNIIHSSKAPRDPQAFEKAKTDDERKKAYCFCPIIRERMDEGMPVTFCYCGAGWYRQQWEGIIGRPVRVHIIESVLNGGDRCQFAIHLPKDIFSVSP